MISSAPEFPRGLKELARQNGIETEYYDLSGELHQASTESLIAVLNALGVQVDASSDFGALLSDDVETVNASEDASPTSVCYSSSQNDPRTWGVFAPLYAIRSGFDWGAGGYHEGEELVKWIGANGGKYWGTLPITATHLKEPSSPSPYWPVSRLFWDEFFIDPTATDEFQQSTKAQELVASAKFVHELAELRKLKFVDYSRTMALKRSVLEVLAKEFFTERNTSRIKAFGKYVKTYPDVFEYAAFRTAQEEISEDWHEWPTDLKIGSETPTGCNTSTFNYHLYAQWIADEQLTKLGKTAKSSGVSLYLDLPVGVHPSGYDAWKFQDLFANGISVGAPPDPLGPEGQNWGFAPLKPEVLSNSATGYFTKILQRQMSKCGMLRIDHVMGFHRLFWIPKGMSGREGVYVRYPSKQLFNILAEQSNKQYCEVVGEDLGTVPDVVRADMKTRDVKGLYILPFEARLDTAEILKQPPVKSVASLNTHDLVPYAGYLKGTDIRDRVEHGLLKDTDLEGENRSRQRFVAAVTNKLHLDGYLDEKELGKTEALTIASHRFLAASNAEIVLINIEDLWGETEPQNRPGTVDPVPNWRKKLALTIEEIRGRQGITDMLYDINYLRNEGGSEMNAKTTSTKSRSTKKTAPKNPILSPASIGETLPIFRLSDDDKYLFNEGSHLKLYDKLGAHLDTVDGVTGCHFAVWAPDAAYVHVIGDFNGWNRTMHPLFANDRSGVWEGFIPGIENTTIYKYFIRSNINGYQTEKADPFAFHAETSPKTGSIVWQNGRTWNDSDWMANRSAKNGQGSPISIYEMHFGSWRRVVEDGERPLSYLEMAEQLPNYLNELGFTHVEFMPIMEHPFNGSWGYQLTGYFAPTSRFGTPQDFMHLIDKLHQAGIGVILDWVPSHFPTDGHGLAFFDGTHLYEHADSRQGFHPDWGSLIFNFGRNEVGSFLLSSAFYWLEKFHIDGIRVDAVASMLYLDYSRKAGEWIPNKFGGRENLEAISFLRRLNEEVYGHFPDVQVYAEESTSWPMVSRPTYLGGLGFGFKWDMGWMHDTLDYFAKDPIHRRFHHSSLTFRMLYAWHENFLLPLSHDEVVHGKGSLLGRMPGDLWQKFANLRLLFLAQFTQPGKKLLFMGGELGQWAEWNHDRSLDWHLLQYSSHEGLKLLVGDLNRLYRAEKALHELDVNPAGFEWVDCNDANTSTISFLRWSEDHRECILVVLNYTPETHFEYRVGIPSGGKWVELLNSDSGHYSGSGKGNLGEAFSTGHPFHGRPDSLVITLPPLGGVILKLKPEIQS